MRRERSPVCTVCSTRLPQIEMITGNVGGIDNLRKHIMVNYKHEAGYDEGGVSRDFFTNFSLGMPKNTPCDPPRASAMK